MGFVFRLDDYPRYLQRVGGATYIDVTRRTDPARIGRVWGNLYAVVRAYGAPWIVQVWTKDAVGVLAQGGSVLLSGVIYTRGHLILMALCAVLVFQRVQAFDWTRKLSWPKVFIIAVLYTLSLMTMFAQSFRSFLYFQF